MNNYKDDIVATRKGCLGGSDAKLIQSVAINGEIPKSAIKRLAICKGLTEQPQFTNPAIEFGNYVEEMVFNSLYENDTRWQSNPCLVSERYSRKNVRVIDHVDFYLQDDEKKVITIGECKATRLTYAQTYDEYKWQLYHHYLLGKEVTNSLGGYKVKILLCHYCTEGVDLTQPFEFDPSRLTVKQLRNMEKLSKSYRITEGMDIINDYLETLTEYYEGDEISYNYLPSNVQKQFDLVANTLQEIKAKEAQVNVFKEKLCTFLQEKNIKSIKSDMFSVTLVDGSESVSVDYKNLFAQEIEAKRPRVAKKLKEMYKKKNTRKPYVVIKIKNND